MNRYFIYKMYDSNDSVIYVGRTTNLKMRMYQHFGSGREPWKDDVRHIKVAMCRSYYDMCIYELYYIGKLKPKYNKEYMNEDEDIYIEIKELSFLPYKDIHKHKTHVEINKELIKKYVTIYGDYETKINKNVDEFDKSSLSDRWYFKELNRNKVEQVIKNANNFNSNLFKNFKNPSIAFPEEVTFDGFNTKLKGLKRIVNKYEVLEEDQYSKLNKLIYLRNTYGNTSNKTKQDEDGLHHFLTFISKSSIVNKEPVIVYCPSSRVRELFNKYIKS